MKTFPFYKQPDTMDCGPTCLRMIAKYYGKSFSIQRLREMSGINREGVSLLGISQAAERIGFRTYATLVNLEGLREVEFPCILHWKQSHFVILYKIKKDIYYIADPAKGLLKYSQTEFKSYWLSTRNTDKSQGIILMLQPVTAFHAQDGDDESKFTLAHFTQYLIKYKQLTLQLFVGLGVGSLLQLILPFLTQSLVDTGINTRNLNFVYVILVAQTMLLFGRLSVDFLRSWILLHISTRINISILTDFIIKLMRLPMAFFDTKMTGDIMQRMADQSRIQSFLTGTTLTIIFSIFNMVVFTAVLAWYNTSIFLIFIASSTLYMTWVVLFLKKRRVLDFKRFDVASKNQNAIIQLVSGIQEIKLNNCEQQKRWEWERIQANLFKLSIRGLSLGQFQQVGAFFINEGKNILITFIVARLVISGELTLGGMMAVQYVIGQLNSPIEQVIVFLQQLQDAKMSLERLNEIHAMVDEEPTGKVILSNLPLERNIELTNVTFTYPGAGNEPVLSEINLCIPEGKTTAIVGMSGSGKTTILKLLLRFYKPDRGQIKVGGTVIDGLAFKTWREQCGTVMQEGFIFSDTISRNIAVGVDFTDPQKLQHAINVANLTSFILSLPLGLDTKIGQEGNGISQGQKQRILIARAVYKNPQYIFFDEATNALDANNEKIIMENLETFFKGRTVVIVAHRLSTVRNADHIVVLDQGKIIEQGTHSQLAVNNGPYFDLVRNQLELGS